MSILTPGLRTEIERRAEVIALTRRVRELEVLAEELIGAYQPWPGWGEWHKSQVNGVALARWRGVLDGTGQKLSDEKEPGS